MPAYSRTSARRLGECHPDLQTLFNEVIKEWDCSILCGARSKDEQDEAVRMGRSKKRWPKSNHNVDGKHQKTAWAADAAPYPIDWKDGKRFAFFAGIVLETARRLKAEGRMKYAVRWGGDWDSDGNIREHSFFDGPHFELVGVKVGE
jgi:peptidoglycan LD-endopeptidase CwlK